MELPLCVLFCLSCFHWSYWAGFKSALILTGIVAVVRPNTISITFIEIACLGQESLGL
jgi:hypothetical protein